MIKFFGKNRKITIAKEITKFWEIIHKTNIKNLINWLKYDKKRYKGEIVLIIEGKKNKKSKIIEKNVLRTYQILKKKLPKSSCIKLTSKIHKIKKNLLYKYILKKNNEIKFHI